MTIKEFADSIGVSTTTVSRAINGRGRISSNTRSMVLEKMEELGFTPNVNAQRLSDGRTSLVAIDFGARHDYLSDMFLVEITRGLQDLLELRGYGLLLSGPGEVFRRWVKTRAVDGVILIGEYRLGTAPYDIAQAGTPCVVIGHQPAPARRRLASVVIDIRYGARRVARLLADLGHRQIGFIGSTPHAQTDVLPPFREELSKLGIDVQDRRVITAGPTPQGADSAMEELLSGGQAPTAVFARTDLHAAAALRCAKRLGFRVPEDISIVGHDDVPLAQLVDPPLTTVRVDCMEIARIAIDALFRLLDHPTGAMHPKLAPTELIVRGTTAPPPPHGRNVRLGGRPEREPAPRLGAAIERGVRKGSEK